MSATREARKGTNGANPGVDDLHRLAKDVGLEKCDSEPILERVVESCRSLVKGGGV